jgi:hypothetical protein
MLQILSLLKNALRKKHARWAAWGMESLILILILKGFINLGAGKPEKGSLFFRPAPDAAEFAWVAQAFARGRSPLLPIVNELHPSRYSPIHPFLLSLWIRINWGNPDAIHTWSLYAIILGTAGLYILAIQNHWPRHYRILSAYLLLFTPFFVNQTRGFMQEPTIFLLFSWGILFWYNGMRRSSGEKLIFQLSNKRDMVRYGLNFAAGLLLGAAGCIRLTIFPLFLFLAFAMVLVKSLRQAWMRIAIFLLGVSVIILVSGIYLYKIAGIPFVSAYQHWMPGVRYFAWKNAFIEPPNYKVGLPNYLLTAQELSGIRKSGFLFGWQSPVLLFIGGFLLVFSIRKKMDADRKNPLLSPILLFLLFLFALSQIVVHLFYNYYDLRFFILVYPIFVISGLAGWNLTISKIYHAKIMRKIYVIILAAGILALIAGIGNINHAWEVFSFMAQKTDALKTSREEIRIHKRYGEFIPALSCPIFVDRLPVLNARILLGLHEYPFPIAPLERNAKTSGDGHTIQFLWYQVKPPVKYLDPGFLWPGNPYENSLFDLEKGYFQEKLIEALLSHYGKIGIYYPLAREVELGPFFSNLDRNNYRIINANLEEQWALIIIQKPWGIATFIGD